MIHGPERAGMIRIVLEKRAKPGRGHEVEVLFYETFDTGLCRGTGPANTAKHMAAELGVDQPAAEAADSLPPGLYELVGDFMYEFDPGFDSPNGPAEPDAWWWIDNEMVQAVTEEQAGWFRAMTASGMA